MATSGSTDFSMDARSIITKAFRLTKIVGGSDTPSADEIDAGEQALNLLLKTWGAKEHLWIVTEGEQALTGGQRSYVIADARRMISVRRRISNIDTPLIELSRQEYYDLPTKAQQGMPTSWYFDPQRQTRTLYLWLSPSAAIADQATLHFTYLRVIEDIDALENDPDVPQEWLEALIYSLAMRIGPEFGADERVMPRIEAMAAQLLNDLSSQDQEDASIYFQPARR